MHTGRKPRTTFTDATRAGTFPIFMRFRPGSFLGAMGLRLQAVRDARGVLCGAALGLDPTLARAGDSRGLVLLIALRAVSGAAVRSPNLVRRDMSNGFHARGDLVVVPCVWGSDVNDASVGHTWCHASDAIWKSCVLCGEVSAVKVLRRLRRHWRSRETRRGCTCPFCS